MDLLPITEAYKAAFESVVMLLKIEQERALSAEESVQLAANISLCRQYENQ